MHNKYGLIIHGGCGTHDPKDKREEAHLNDQLDALRPIINHGWELLEEGKSAVTVVEETIKLLEDNPSFNAGRGAAIGTSGQVELDACIMDGKTLSCGAVTGIEGYRNPISIARLVMEKTKHVFLMGNGANEFAAAMKQKKFPREYFYTPHQEYWLAQIRKQEKDTRYKGTVGVAVRDKKGNLAAGTSTGGMSNKMKGRVGDSPLVGAGTCADNRYGAVSATGYGEQIIKTGLTRLALSFVRFEKMTMQEAVVAAIADMGTLKDGLGGLIGIDALGNFGAYTNEVYMPHAYMGSSLASPFIRAQCGKNGVLSLAKQVLR